MTENMMSILLNHENANRGFYVTFDENDTMVIGRSQELSDLDLRLILDEVSGKDDEELEDM